MFRIFFYHEIDMNYYWFDLGFNRVLYKPFIKEIKQEFGLAAETKTLEWWCCFQGCGLGFLVKGVGRGARWRAPTIGWRSGTWVVVQEPFRGA